MIMVRSCSSSPCSTPKRSRKNQVKNPYSSQGLDKFSALLSELEEKRQKIYSEAGSKEDISMVRFVFTGSNECVPVLVRNPPDAIRSSGGLLSDKAVTQESRAKEKMVLKLKVPEGSEAETNKKRQAERKKCCVVNMKLHRLKRPSYLLPVTVILILIFLAVFSRSAAIMCTCIGWYVVPMINDQHQSSKVMRPVNKTKKEYVRRLSNESKASSGSSSPRSPPHHVATKEKSPPIPSAHRRSW